MPIVVDPTNVFHEGNIRPLATSPNSNYLKMRYILANPDKFSGYILGSSRVGSIHVEKMLDEKVYNMTYSAGSIVEFRDNVRTMFTNGLKPSVIYLGLDGGTYVSDERVHISQPWRCPYEYLYNDPAHFYSLMLNPYYNLRALITILMSPKPKDKSGDSEIFYSYGWWADYDTVSDFDWGSVKYVHKKNDKARDHRLIVRALDCVREIRDMCESHNTILVVFTNPMYCITHLQAVDRDYLELLEDMAEIVDFLNFSSINDITLNRTNYLDDSHYNAYIGDEVLNVLCGGNTDPELQAQGFGVKVTPENVKDFINLLKQQADDFRHNNSPAK